MDTVARIRSFDQCTCNALRRAARQVSQFYDGKLAPSGLRVSQFSMLVVIKALESTTVNELAHHLGIDRTTTGKNLRPLQRDGLVAVGRLAGDGRSREVTITPEGLARLAAAMPLWRSAQREFERANGREAAAELRVRLTALRTGPD